MAGALGFEPRMVVPKTTALPLGYAPSIIDLIYHKIIKLNSFCNYAPVARKLIFNYFHSQYGCFLTIKHSITGRS